MDYLKEVIIHRPAGVPPTGDSPPLKPSSSAIRNVAISTSASETSGGPHFAAISFERDAAKSFAVRLAEAKQLPTRQWRTSHWDRQSQKEGIELYRISCRAIRCCRTPSLQRTRMALFDLRLPIQAEGGSRTEPLDGQDRSRGGFFIAETWVDNGC
jgi:hypothetical protein